MKRTYFIQHDQRIRRILGCDRATLIFDRLEFYSSRQPEGFYKFLEPNSHKLYRQYDSWTELLDCHRTSFWRAFKLIGKKHNSRWAFEKSEDRFEGKLYASYYDRNTNRMFFVRNHDAVKEFLATVHAGSELGKKTNKPEVNGQSCSGHITLKSSLRTEQNARSYKESKLTSLDLSKDKSHASDEIIKKMIDIWTAIVGEGRGQIELKGKIIPFLKKALTDQFNNCLQKWKEYCTKIARSKFLMGEKTPWKATLEWALKFDVIAKILSGDYYGIGDRTPKAILPSEADLQEEILNSEETQEIKDFRVLCLKTVGTGKYICQFKNLMIEFREDGEIALIAPHKFGADYLEQNSYSYLRAILQGLGEQIAKILILAPGETRGRIIELERGGGALPGYLATPTVVDLNSEEIYMERGLEEDETLSEVSLKDMLQGSGIFPGYESIREDADFLLNMVESKEEGAASKNKQIPTVSLETKELRAKLRKTIMPKEFPGWLGNIEVEGIGKDGTVVALLEDDFEVGWCRSRFSKEVFEAAASLWSGVNKLTIRKKEVDIAPFSIENTLEKPESVAEKPTFEQVIESFLSVVTRPLTSSPGKVMGTPGMQRSCQAFG